MELVIFDLDGTLVELKIGHDEFERCRSYWASYLTSRDVPTTLKPLLPELKRISLSPVGSSVKKAILKSFDDIELACDYRSLGRIEALLNEAKGKFLKVALVTHNSSALWRRLAEENTWPRLLDQVVTRDDTDFCKPDPRVCEAVFKDLTPNSSFGEFWVIGNSESDRGLASNLRRIYRNRVVRSIMIDPAATAQTKLTGHPDLDVPSLDCLLDLLPEASG